MSEYWFVFTVLCCMFTVVGNTTHEPGWFIAAIVCGAIGIGLVLA